MPEATRVDFYILAGDKPASRLQFACRLTEKAYDLKNRVYAHAGSQEESRQLDELLWTFRQGSFVPHALLAEAGEEAAPVVIGSPEHCQKQGELLINLAATTPEFATNFARVAEIVDASETSRQAGRERFKQYRDLGLAPVTHNID